MTVPGLSFVSPSRSLYLPDVARLDLPPATAPELAETLAAIGRAHGIAGAIPFDPTSRAAALWTMSASGSSAPEVSSRAGRPAPETRPPRPPAPAAYLVAVERALDRIRTTALRKVVLARYVEFEAIDRLPRPALLSRLANRNLGGFTYEAQVGRPQEARRLLGASPELLLRRAGTLVESHPLAGSIPRGTDPDDDRRRAEFLLASPKDVREHRIVVDGVAGVLAPLCRSLHVPPAPRLWATDTMWHLCTPISGRLVEPAPTSIELALALHPTSAVCGDPGPLAGATIAELEGFDRGFFGGLVGWSDRTGDGEWAVAIRCAESSPGRCRVYAGAGIVEGSVPEQELRETAAKMRTMLAALDAGFEVVEAAQ